MLLTFKYLIKEKLANEDYEIVKEEEIKKQEGNKKNELCEDHQKEIKELKTQIEQKSQMILALEIELKKLNGKYDDNDLHPVCQQAHQYARKVVQEPEFQGKLGNQLEKSRVLLGFCRLGVNESLDLGYEGWV